MPKKNQVEKTN